MLGDSTSGDGTGGGGGGAAHAHAHAHANAYASMVGKFKSGWNLYTIQSIWLELSSIRYPLRLTCLLVCQRDGTTRHEWSPSHIKIATLILRQKLTI